MRRTIRLLALGVVALLGLARTPAQAGIWLARASLARFFHLAAIRPDKSRGPGDPARGRYVVPDCGVKPPTL